jgi:PucR-like helix-turn-helix protein/diguanylate cyclase with GGDEF domain
MPSQSMDRDAREGLHARLSARWPEIEEAVLTRVFSVDDPSESLADTEYTEGLREAVKASLRYGLAAVKLGEERSPPVPPVLLTQTRVAARSGVSLETVLRRCFAGNTLFVDFIVEEAEAGGYLEREGLQGPLRIQATVFDRLIAAVSEEYAHEEQERSLSTPQRDAKRIERLLAGELVDTAELAYRLEDHHLGAVTAGPGAMAALRELATALDRRLLFVEREEEVVWAWLGGRTQISAEELKAKLTTWPERLPLAFGEPGHGLTGWRLTHRQARAAWPIALRGPERIVCYAEVALLAATLQDDLFATSLRQLYLDPLEAERDGGQAARATLRAYFAAGRNVSSAAAALGVSRRTVANRLHVIEERLGLQVHDCAAEIEAALRLDDLNRASARTTGTT